MLKYGDQERSVVHWVLKYGDQERSVVEGLLKYGDKAWSVVQGLFNYGDLAKDYLNMEIVPDVSQIPCLCVYSLTARLFKIKNSQTYTRFLYFFPTVYLKCRCIFPETRFFFSTTSLFCVITLFRKSCRLRDHVEKGGGAREIADDNMAARCMLG